MTYGLQQWPAWLQDSPVMSEQLLDFANRSCGWEGSTWPGACTPGTQWQWAAWEGIQQGWAPRLCAARSQACHARMTVKALRVLGIVGVESYLVDNFAHLFVNHAEPLWSYVTVSVHRFTEQKIVFPSDKGKGCQWRSVPTLGMPTVRYKHMCKYKRPFFLVLKKYLQKLSSKGNWLFKSKQMQVSYGVYNIQISYRYDR